MEIALKGLFPTPAAAIQVPDAPARNAWLERAVPEQRAGHPSIESSNSYAQAKKDGNRAPQRKLAHEKPLGETVDYDTLLKSRVAMPPPRRSQHRAGGCGPRAVPPG